MQARHQGLLCFQSSLFSPRLGMRYEIQNASFRLRLLRVFGYSRSRKPKDLGSRMGKQGSLHQGEKLRTNTNLTLFSNQTSSSRSCPSVLMSCIGESLLTSLFTFCFISIQIYEQNAYQKLQNCWVAKALMSHTFFVKF